MKRLAFLSLLLLLCAASGYSQIDTLQVLPPKAKHYVMPKLELQGVLALISYPFFRASANVPPGWPNWQMATVEVGLGRRTAMIGGIGGRYLRAKSGESPGSNTYRDSKLYGFKYLIGFRTYLTGSGGNGLYLQPTAKLVWQGYELNLSNGQSSVDNRDFIFSTRFGWQNRIVKGLHVDVSVGPGIGVRSDYTHDTYGFGYYWDVRMDEIDHSPVAVIDGYGRNWTSAYLIGDASLALGWKF